MMAQPKAKNSHPTPSIPPGESGVRGWCKSAIETSHTIAKPLSKIARFDFVSHAAQQLTN
jgi:hypothetical protein